MQPWRLLADPSGYIFAWLVGYSGGLGSIAGVLIADYWLVRKKRLALPAICYRTKGGLHVTPAAGTGAPSSPRCWGCAPGVDWVWLVVGADGMLYDYAWFVGFGTSLASFIWR